MKSNKELVKKNVKMSGNADFDKAAEAIKGIQGYTPSNDELAQLYGLYKQR